MKWCPVPCPPGGLGGLAPQESPLITRALPPQRPCLAPVPCPQFFSSEKIFDQIFFVRPSSVRPSVRRPSVRRRFHFERKNHFDRPKKEPTKSNSRYVHDAVARVSMSKISHPQGYLRNHWLLHQFRPVLKRRGFPYRSTDNPLQV